VTAEFQCGRLSVKLKQNLYNSGNSAATVFSITSRRTLLKALLKSNFCQNLVVVHAGHKLSGDVDGSLAAAWCANRYLER